MELKMRPYLLKKIIAILEAVAIASVIQIFLSAFQIAGDHSFYYAGICGLIIFSNTLVNLLLEKGRYNRFYIHAFLGLLVGLVMGYSILALYEGGFYPTGIFSEHPFVTALLIYWFFSTGLFGFIFSSALWFTSCYNFKSKWSE